ncbi:MAG: ElyC/SanA/YdcF family protein [Anaerolineales bacterium]|nr:MAG: ElyC/SanA/YdcF family protein [Anaerolineales bacterium]
MLKKFWKFLWRLAWTFGLLALLGLFLPRFVFLLYSKPRTYPVTTVPPRRVAIVFGAGLWRDGSPTPILQDRVQTAADLYFAGKAEKLLMSGDNRFLNYNEPEAMRQFALGLGVPDKDIVLDYAGRRTYDTCYRARDIFRVDSAILVTQEFHLPRAVYLCNMLGVDGVGVPADIQYYRKASRAVWSFRESLATLGAINDILFKKPVPVLGDPEPIFTD